MQRRGARGRARVARLARHPLPRMSTQCRTRSGGRSNSAWTWTRPLCSAALVTTTGNELPVPVPVSTIHPPWSSKGAPFSSHLDGIEERWHRRMSSSVVTLREDELAHASRSSSTAHESLLKSARSTKITSNSHLEQMKGGGWCTAATWAAAATAERAWRRHGTASKDGDADLCSCGLAANHRVGIRRRLRLERLILPGRPARCQSEAHAEATAELLAPTWSGSALHAKIPKMECND